MNARISCCIIDDEIYAINALERFVIKYPNLELMRSMTDSQEGLKFLKENEVDFVFLDISMEGLSGMEMVSMINSKVVFTTAHRKHAIEALGYPGVIDYILKPFTFERFAVSMKRVETAFPSGGTGQPAESTGYVVKTKIGTEFIQFDQIEYIKAGGYSSIVYYRDLVGNLNSGLVSEPLSSIEAKLPAITFARIHKSHIVNKSKILKTTYEYVLLGDKISLSLGNAFRENLTNK